MNALETVFEVFGCLRIAISPALIGIIMGCIIYVNMNGPAGIGLGIAVGALGIIVGIIWATKVWKKRGTIQFLSRTMATPELDNPDENRSKKRQA